MLLRGVKFPPSTLNASDIEQIKGRAARSGRAHGSVPLERDSRGYNSFNFAPAWQNNRHSQGPQKTYNGTSNYPCTPDTGWQPPSAGNGGFARGPPPPPSEAYGSYGQKPPPPPGYSQSSYGHASQSERGPPGYSRPDEWYRGDEQHRRGGNSSRGYDSYRGRR
jgi:5'-3' exoribonuclease 2